MKKRISLLLALVLMLSMLSIPAFAAEGSPDATIFMATTADPVTCDPAYATDGQSGMVVDRVFSGLTRYNPDGSVTPEIAESYTISEDGKTYTFTIREGITFHDGTPCDPEAVLWNLQRQMGDNATPEMGYAVDIFGQIETAEVDGQNVVITLKEANSAFIMNTAMRVGMGIVSPTAHEADPEGFARNPVGSGPYKFVEWVSDQYVILERFDDYILGPAKNKTVTLRIIKESGTRTAEMLTGGIDLMGDISLDDLAALEAAENVNLIKNPGKNIGYLAFADYEKNALFSDIRLRQAVAYALDLDTINQGLYGDNMVTAKSIIPPIMQGGDGEFTTIGYDPEKAKELMAEAGYPDGFTFTLLAYNVNKGYNPAAERLAVQIMAELAKVNIGVNVVIKPWADFIASMYMAEPDYDAIVAGWGAASNNTAYMLQLLDGKNAGEGPNHSGYNNPEFNDLLAQAKASTDYDTTSKLYAQAAQLANDDLPIIVLGHGTEYAAASTNIINATDWYGRWGAQEDHMEKAE